MAGFVSVPTAVARQASMLHQHYVEAVAAGDQAEIANIRNAVDHYVTNMPNPRWKTLQMELRNIDAGRPPSPKMMGILREAAASNPAPAVAPAAESAAASAAPTIAAPAATAAPEQALAAAANAAASGEPAVARQLAASTFQPGQFASIAQKRLLTNAEVASQYGRQGFNVPEGWTPPVGSTVTPTPGELLARQMGQNLAATGPTLPGATAATPVEQLAAAAERPTLGARFASGAGGTAAKGWGSKLLNRFAPAETAAGPAAETAAKGWGSKLLNRFAPAETAAGPAAETAAGRLARLGELAGSSAGNIALSVGAPIAGNAVSHAIQSGFAGTSEEGSLLDRILQGGVQGAGVGAGIGLGFGPEGAIPGVLIGAGVGALKATFLGNAHNHQQEYNAASQKLSHALAATGMDPDSAQQVRDAWEAQMANTRSSGDVRKVQSAFMAGFPSMVSSARQQQQSNAANLAFQSQMGDLLNSHLTANAAAAANTRDMLNALYDKQAAANILPPDVIANFRAEAANTYQGALNQNAVFAAQALNPNATQLQLGSQLQSAINQAQTRALAKAAAGAGTGSGSQTSLTSALANIPAPTG